MSSGKSLAQREREFSENVAKLNSVKKIQDMIAKAKKAKEPISLLQRALELRQENERKDGKSLAQKEREFAENVAKINSIKEIQAMIAKAKEAKEPIALLQRALELRQENERRDGKSNKQTPKKQDEPPAQSSRPSNIADRAKNLAKEAGKILGVDEMKKQLIPRGAIVRPNAPSIHPGGLDLSVDRPVQPPIALDPETALLISDAREQRARHDAMKDAKGITTVTVKRSQSKLTPAEKRKREAARPKLNKKEKGRLRREIKKATEASIKAGADPNEAHTAQRLLNASITNNATMPDNIVVKNAEQGTFIEVSKDIMNRITESKVYPLIKRPVLFGLESLVRHSTGLDPRFVREVVTGALVAGSAVIQDAKSISDIKETVRVESKEQIPRATPGASLSRASALAERVLALPDIKGGTFQRTRGFSSFNTDKARKELIVIADVLRSVRGDIDPKILDRLEEDIARYEKGGAAGGWLPAMSENLVNQANIINRIRDPNAPPITSKVSQDVVKQQKDVGANITDAKTINFDALHADDLKAEFKKRALVGGNSADRERIALEVIDAATGDSKLSPEEQKREIGLFLEDVKVDPVRITSEEVEIKGVSAIREKLRKLFNSGVSIIAKGGLIPAVGVGAIAAGISAMQPPPTDQPFEVTKIESDAPVIKAAAQPGGKIITAKGAPARGLLRPKFIIPSVDIIDQPYEEQIADQTEWDLFNFVVPTSEGANGTARTNILKFQNEINQKIMYHDAGVDRVTGGNNALVLPEYKAEKPFNEDKLPRMDFQKYQKSDLHPNSVGTIDPFSHSGIEMPEYSSLNQYDAGLVSVQVEHSNLYGIAY